MRKWTLTAKHRMITLLISAVFAGVLGYVESLIPAIFPILPYLRVHVGMLFALFVLLTSSPIDAVMVWGVRCMVFGLVQDDGFAIIFETLAGVAAFFAICAILKRFKGGSLPVGVGVGFVYAVVYTCLASITAKSGALFALLPQTLAFYIVNHFVLGILAYVALRFIPEKVLFDE